MIDRDKKAAQDCGQIDALAPAQFGTWNGEGHVQKSE
jgi:hypothetical protein